MVHLVTAFIYYAFAATAERVLDARDEVKRFVCQRMPVTGILLP